MTGIIIVDYNHDVYDRLSQKLKQNDIIVLGKASNAEDAYRIFVEKKPDIVILGILMSLPQGSQIIKKMKKKNPDVKIIIMSSKVDYDFKTEDVSAVLRIPYDFFELLKVITNFRAV